MPAEPGQNQVPQSEPAQLELCPNCLEHNVEGAHFCRNCGGPLSSYATIGPFEHLFQRFPLTARLAHAGPRRADQVADRRVRRAHRRAELV